MLLLPRVSLQGFVGRYGINRLPMMLMLAIQTKTLLVLHKALQIHRKQVQYVFFLVIMCRVMRGYFLLGAASKRCISSLQRGEFILWCAQFSYAYTVRLIVDHISENQAAHL